MKALALVTVALAFSTAQAQTVTLTAIEKGASAKIGGYRPQRAPMSGEKPATLKKTPEGLTAVEYGIIPIAVEGRAFHIITGTDGDGEVRLFVDSNGNGDLTDDGSTDWTSKPTKGRDGKEYRQWNGGAMLELGTSESPMNGYIQMYRFDKEDPDRKAVAANILYYADYAYQGTLNLGGKDYTVLLVDDLTTGDFRGKDGDKGSGVRLLLDANSNGKFERRGEDYDIRKPFNIGGTTYEIADMAPSGASFAVRKSSQTVAEIPPPPDHSAGKPITAFKATTTDGKALSFPESYKGKIVLMDFWATWCGPCMAEVPNLVSVYEEFHGQGMEVLGISLDRADSLEKIREVTGKHRMTWPQVYDGKYWQAEIAELYVVKAIPAVYLVDGDTGLVITDKGLRGEALRGTIEKALADKKANQKG
jgi:peroxiredoxin